MNMAEIDPIIASLNGSDNDETVIRTNEIVKIGYFDKKGQ